MLSDEQLASDLLEDTPRLPGPPAFDRKVDHVNPSSALHPAGFGLAGLTVSPEASRLQRFRC